METDLDRLHRRMEDAPDSAGARLAFYDRLADAELWLLLAREPQDDVIEPALFDLEEGRVALVFDREERLADFSGAPAPYAALPGRVVARMLAGEGIGLGLNLGVAPSAFLMPAAAVAWLAGALDHAPEPVLAAPAGYRPPADVPEALLATLDAKLARLAGAATRAHLVSVTYGSGGQGHLLAFEGARPGTEPALAKAVSEALAFSGVEAGSLDVGFYSTDDPALAPLARHALTFDLAVPEREMAQVLSPAAPGMDPARPPKLR